LVLINEDNRLPDGFEDLIELITVENVAGDIYEIEKRAYEAFTKLRDDILKNEGIQIELDSVYRSVKTQEEIYEKNLRLNGLEYTRKYVAKPGHSEHHTGLAIDVAIIWNGIFYRKMAEMFTIDNLYKIVQKKLPEYGFILRYPERKESITKIGYEPWHFRYIDSPEIAKEITSKGLCFEEYMI